MDETACAGRGSFDRSVSNASCRRRVHRLVRWGLVVSLAVLAGEAGAVPVTVGLGIGTDVPAVTVASGLTIDRGDPVGLALAVPILVGRLRIEPQFAVTDRGGSYGKPPPGLHECPGLMACRDNTEEGLRTVAGLALGPAWSIGERGRVWLGPWGGLTSRWYDSVRQDWSLGLNVGGEYFFDDRFTFGLDVRAAYTSVEAGGTYTRTDHSDISTQRVNHEFDRGWLVGIDALAAFRLYLN